MKSKFKPKQILKPLYNKMNQRLNQCSSNHDESREEEKKNEHKSWIKQPTIQCMTSNIHTQQENNPKKQ